ncbi:glycosyltransferase [bacterium]|nr:MAG: glycosyltransferase [bacterium]
MIYVANRVDGDRILFEFYKPKGAIANPSTYSPSRRRKYYTCMPRSTLPKLPKEMNASPSSQNSQSNASSARRRPRVFWLLSGDETIASSRIQGYLIHQHLLERGVDSRLLLAPPFWLKELPWKSSEEIALTELCGTDIVVLQKLRGEAAQSLARALRKSGSITVYIDCDYRPENKVAFECDVVVCPSETLANFYRENGASEVMCVCDPAEFWSEPEEISKRYTNNSSQDKLKLCWVGNKTNWLTLEPLQALLREPEFADFQLVTVSNHPDADVVWSLETVRQVLDECDIGVVPTVGGFKQAVKSSNRIVQCMAIGLPVIAGRIPSYEETMRHGETGLFADTPEEWRDALRILRDSNKRRELSTNAYKEVRQKFSLDSIVTDWLRVFEDLDARPKNTPPLTESPITEEKEKLLTAQLLTRAQLGFAEEARRQQNSQLAWNCLKLARKNAEHYPTLKKETLGATMKTARWSTLNTLTKSAPIRFPLRIVRAIARRVKRKS